MFYCLNSNVLLYLAAILCIREEVLHEQYLSTGWGQKENFHFYSQAICCWRCRNNTGVGAKNKTAVYLPLLELEKWHAQWSDAAVCFYWTLSFLSLSHSPTLSSVFSCLCCLLRQPRRGFSRCGPWHSLVACPIQIWRFKRRLIIDKNRIGFTDWIPMKSSWVVGFLSYLADKRIKPIVVGRFLITVWTDSMGLCYLWEKSITVTPLSLFLSAYSLRHAHTTACKDTHDVKTWHCHWDKLTITLRVRLEFWLGDKCWCT